MIMLQSASCSLMDTKTSGLLYKGVKIITNLLNFISDLVIMQNIQYFLLVYVYPLDFLNLKTDFQCISSVRAAVSVWLQI